MDHLLKPSQTGFLRPPEDLSVGSGLLFRLGILICNRLPSSNLSLIDGSKEQILLLIHGLEAYTKDHCRREAFLPLNLLLLSKVGLKMPDSPDLQFPPEKCAYRHDKGLLHSKFGGYPCRGGIVLVQGLSFLQRRYGKARQEL
jgi:hypothetical protein